MAPVLAALLFLCAPAIILAADRKIPAFRKFGPIVLCYIAGVLLGMSGLLPASVDPIRVSLSEASLGLALPLLLFSVDMKAWQHVAGRAMLSMLMAIIAVVAVASALYAVLLGQGTVQPEQYSAMAIGMYTGGIANLGAIKLALDIPDGRYLLFATVDTAVGALYLLFVLSIAQRIFSRFLPPFTETRAADADVQSLDDDFASLLRPSAVGRTLVALGAAAICVGGALVLTPMLPFGNPQITVIILLTSFGLLASFIKMIRQNISAPKLGMYLIYVFTFCIAASLDPAELKNMDLVVLGFVVIATFGSLALHALLCRIMRIDVDTFLVTSVAAVMSPAFVPMVVRSLNNPAVLMSGMATGILGFAIGNYLGISVALLLASGG